MQQVVDIPGSERLYDGTINAHELIVMRIIELPDAYCMRIIVGSGSPRALPNGEIRPRSRRFQAMKRLEIDVPRSINLPEGFFAGRISHDDYWVTWYSSPPGDVSLR